MKTLLLFLVAASMSTLTACNKSTTATADADLQGTWELRKSSAAMMPIATIHAAGNGTTLKFNTDTYQAYDKEALKSSGSYTVVPDSTFEQSVCLVTDADKFRRRIIYDGVTAEPKQFFHITGNTLIVKAGCYALDGGTQREYEKIASAGN